MRRLTPYLLLAVLTLGVGLGIGLGMAEAPVTQVARPVVAKTLDLPCDDLFRQRGE